MIDKLFIYGTLAPNCPNEHILKPLNGSWQEAFVFGELKEEGWGAGMGFPGILLTNTKKVVKGQIFTSSNLSEHLDMLDKFEGEDYKRVVVQATLEDNSIVQAYIYTIK